jgi:threonine/homoserine/homoserine lactone efflux protein
MAIGQTTGFFSSIQFLLGAATGCVILDSLVACGLGELIISIPVIATTLRFVGLVYILYLAGKILAMQFTPQKVEKRFSFLEGFLIHPLSPKSWAMAVVAFSQFMKLDQPIGTQIVIFVFSFLVGLLVFHSTWCAAGALIPHFISSKRTLNCINWIMVILMTGATGYAIFA